MGFDCGRVDGLFGVETEQALRDFQRNIGLVADGTCGPATFKALTQLSRTVVGGRRTTCASPRRSTGPDRRCPASWSSSTPAAATSGGASHELDDDLVYDLASRIEGRLSATGCRRSSPAGRRPGRRGACSTDSTGAGRGVRQRRRGRPADLPAGRRARQPRGLRRGDVLLRQRPATATTRRSAPGSPAWCSARSAPAPTWSTAGPPQDLGPAARTRMPAVRIEVGYLPTPATPRGSPTRRSATCSPRPSWRRCSGSTCRRTRTRRPASLRIPAAARLTARPGGRPAPGSSTPAAAPGPPRRRPARTARSAGRAAAVGSGAAAPS